jgi:hypothetical protein
LTYTQQVLFFSEWEEEEENAYKIQEPRFSIDSAGFSSLPEILADSVACWRFSQDSLMQFHVVPVIAQKKIPFFLSFFFPFSLGDGPFCVEVIIIIITNDLISANN